MPSLADRRALAAPGVAPSAAALRVAGAALHTVALVCMVLALWRLLTPSAAPVVTAVVGVDGTLDAPLASLLRAPADSIDVTLQSVPTARDRAVLRVLRGSGRVVRLHADAPLVASAVSAEAEWRASGGTRVQLTGGDSLAATVSDGAGLLDSVQFDSAGVRRRTGPLEGSLVLRGRTTRAAVAPLAAAAPAVARVFVSGAATWESRFLIAALEESGWPVDAAVSLSPKVTVTQGVVRSPSRARHAIAIILPGASAAAIAALPGFVRSGGGVVIVGEAARTAGLGAVRAGTPGALLAGELGAEAGEEPRHGLDLVPVASLSAGSVALEWRDGRVAVAARRIGAGRVVQVGYDNSWLWRMGGNDDAPLAHRRGWNSLLSGLVPLAQPVMPRRATPETDTLDAAPVAALAREIGLPEVRVSRASVRGGSRIAALDLRWLMAIATLALVASWTLRRWRGLA